MNVQIKDFIVFFIVCIKILFEAHKKHVLNKVIKWRRLDLIYKLFFTKVWNI